MTETELRVAVRLGGELLGRVKEYLAGRREAEPGLSVGAAVRELVETGVGEKLREPVPLGEMWSGRKASRGVGAGRNRRAVVTPEMAAAEELVGIEERAAARERGLVVGEGAGEKITGAESESVVGEEGDDALPWDGDLK